VTYFKRQYWIHSVKTDSDPKKRDGRETALRLYLGRLTEKAALCSHTINEILQHHVDLANLMARKINDACNGQHDVRYDGPGTTELAQKIKDATVSLSTHVGRMTYDLKSFVANLKGMSVMERIWQWIKSLISAIAKVFAAISTFAYSIYSASSRRHHPDDTALRQGASLYIEYDFTTEEPLPETLDPVIQFLEKIVPNEVQNAQTKIKKLNSHLEKMERMNLDRQVTLCGPNPAAVAQEWRNVAAQFQKALEQEKSYVIRHTPKILLTTILVQMLLNFHHLPTQLALDHFFDQLLVWFVYIYDSSLFFQQPSELLRALPAQSQSPATSRVHW
jgi:hypothetical protein